MSKFRFFYFFSLLFIFLGPINVYSQDKDIKITQDELKKTGVNYYNYSDINKVNIEVVIIGGVKNPGKYLVPSGITILDLIGLSGGLAREDFYDDIKLIKFESKDSTMRSSRVIDVKLKKLFLREKFTSLNNINPVLSPGDLIVVPLEEKTFWQSLQEVLIIVTPLITIASLIITIQNNK